MTTAVASYTLTTPPALDAPYAFPTTHSRRLASDGDRYARVRPRSRDHNTPNHVAWKRRSTPDATSIAGMDRPMRRDGERSGHSGIGTTSTPTARPNTWFRRLSSSISTSRDSSRTPSSRPASAAYTNGSLAFSQAGSTTPMFPDTTPAPLPPNKLVKRTASLHSSNGSSSPSSGSRLPLPTFRRPATSHQRSATLQSRLSSSSPAGHITSAGDNQGARDSEWRSYFVPRVAADRTPSKRRSSTSIPNPIKRVYPDRRYTPTLVSAKDLVQPAGVELDDGVSDTDENMAAATQQTAPSTASSPFPTQAAFFEESTAPRRSFSISDLLSTGPQPLWRRPASSKGRPWSSRSVRKGRPRVASEPQKPMGSGISSLIGHDSERPAKRRDLTDPKASQRSIYSSSSSQNVTPADSRPEIDLSLGVESPSLQFTPDHSLHVEPATQVRTPSSNEPQRSLSTSLQSAPTRPIRLSAAQSEITSTIGSDSEYLSTGDNSTDYQSDNAFDSIHTRTTRSSSGRRGPHIETIFDDSPPTFSSGRSTKLRDFLSDGQFGNEYGGPHRHSTIEEEDSVVSTPVRSIRNKSVTSTPSGRSAAPQIFSSSPPVMEIMPDLDDADWDVAEVRDGDYGLGIQPHATISPVNGTTYDRNMLFRFGPTLRPGHSHSANSTPRRNGASPMDKTNVFDWSEQQPSPSHPNNSPPRPRTVHGKKDQDSRGSRPSGRRPASGMHARSHSVPVVPDLDGKRSSVVANKFGTWGVGSKAVTEDWNEDFDFDEPTLPVQASIEQDERRIDSGHEMFVPKSIREQQENVVMNIGLLREWGLLIEELKDLRMRAVALDMLKGPYAKEWREVDAMIELADQESEEHTLAPRRSPPSSPGFDDSAFEDTPSTKARLRQSSGKITNREGAGTTGSPNPAREAGVQNQVIITRPRKDSELVAQSVIAALQTKRSTSDPSMLPVSSKKVPFDTATLRHIVPYVNSLKRKVKDALRETEGLYSSPHRRSSPNSRKRREWAEEEPGFSMMFNEKKHDDDTTTQRQSRREGAATDNDGSELSLSNQDGFLATRMKQLNFPK
ncbi:uncharacterized protein CLAFUR5_02104 [Fulvia fulva]|uniref:Uncharacterized protein n=1 Tax=Passalora fulva TaxID=5499 RepID=A0A9Q8L724_PASFU|nr:uncharacterized protein CLAFUR5_02104 [Fulvia fulva]KAK4637111.1 hypothetical protein CLAFUR0_02110 [Fulvia fulva]UJO12004.1 hypothetical protein CLAFUR5_02104 [Fulvia fulva]